MRGLISIVPVKFPIGKIIDTTDGLEHQMGMEHMLGGTLTLPSDKLWKVIIHTTVNYQDVYHFGFIFKNDADPNWQDKVFIVNSTPHVGTHGSHPAIYPAQIEALRTRIMPDHFAYSDSVASVILDSVADYLEDIGWLDKVNPFHASNKVDQIYRIPPNVMAKLMVPDNSLMANLYACRVDEDTYSAVRADTEAGFPPDLAVLMEYCSDSCRESASSYYDNRHLLDIMILKGGLNTPWVSLKQLKRYIACKYPKDRFTRPWQKTFENGLGAQLVLPDYMQPNTRLSVYVNMGEMFYNIAEFTGCDLEGMLNDLTVPFNTILDTLGRITEPFLLDVTVPKLGEFQFEKLCDVTKEVSRTQDPFVISSLLEDIGVFLNSYMQDIESPIRQIQIGSRQPGEFLITLHIAVDAGTDEEIEVVTFFLDSAIRAIVSPSMVFNIP